MTDQIKPVKAWAVVGSDMVIDTGEVFDDELEARVTSKAYDCTMRKFLPHSVIPVTITPGHEAEDET